MSDPAARSHPGWTQNISRVIFGLVSLMLTGLALSLIVYSIVQIVSSFRMDAMPVGRELLDAVGYAVIAVAVFDVAKYIFEEEVLDTTEMRDMAEARRSLTKFISIIVIAIFLEALVATFEASKGEDKLQMLYPTVLIFAGVATMVGLGVFQRLSSLSERTSDDPPVQEESEAAATKGR